MRYFICLPETKLPEKEAYELRMEAIHKLEGAGHRVAYTWFGSEWWSEKSMRDRGVAQVELCYLAKAIEEMSKCEGAYFCEGFDSDENCNLLYQLAQKFNMKIWRANE